MVQKESTNGNKDNDDSDDNDKTAVMVTMCNQLTGAEYTVP